MVQSPSWIANGFAASQEIPRNFTEPEGSLPHLKSVRHLSLSWASPIQSIYPHPTSWRSFLILSTHLRLVSPVVSFLDMHTAQRTPAHLYLQRYCATLLAPFNISNLHSRYTCRSLCKVHVIFLRLQPKVEMSCINCTEVCQPSYLNKKILHEVQTLSHYIR